MTLNHVQIEEFHEFIIRKEEYTNKLGLVIFTSKNQIEYELHNYEEIKSKIQESITFLTKLLSFDILNEEEIKFLNKWLKIKETCLEWFSNKVDEYKSKYQKLLNYPDFYEVIWIDEFMGNEYFRTYDDFSKRNKEHVQRWNKMIVNV